MSGYATTKMSSKGQVVIPEEIREGLHLKAGDLFVVIGQGDTVILKSITPPGMDEFEELLADARQQAKKAGIKKSDMRENIKRIRRKK